jgi:phenylacetate-CoA ligase
MNDAFNHPMMTDRGRAVLHRIREHPNAPVFTNRTGSRLRADDLEAVHRLGEIALGEVVEQHPGWLDAFVEDTVRSVPWFRERTWSTRFLDIAPTSRRDLSASITKFIPDTVPAERLIAYETSGVTGHPLVVPSHPIVAATYLAYHRRALRRIDRDFDRSSPGGVAGVLLGMQERCFTYASVLPLLDEAGFAKINLHPNDWRHPGDRAAFLDDLAPTVIAGDPVSFDELLRLGLRHRPTALLSTSMSLLPALRHQLQETFGCPVLDIYSMNEAGPVAVFDERFGGHVLLQPRMYVEILNDALEPVPFGTRGEITLTGGFNHVLPLLRYRTGDVASLQPVTVDGITELVLVDLVGRPPIRFLTSRGTWINNHELGHAIAHLPAVQFAVHQHADRSLALIWQGNAAAAHQAVDVLTALTGQRVVLSGAAQPVSDTKLRQYTSDLAGGMVGNLTGSEA